MPNLNDECYNCGCAWSSHKGKACPPLRFHGKSAPLILAGLSDDSIEDKIEDYWDKSQSNWRPSATCGHRVPVFGCDSCKAAAFPDDILEANKGYEMERDQ